MRTRSKAANKSKDSTLGKKNGKAKVRVLDNSGQVDKAKKDVSPKVVVNNTDEIVVLDSVDNGSNTEYEFKSHLLALKLQAEEQQAEIARLKRGGSTGISKEDLEKIEAGVEARLRTKLEAEFQATEDRQNLCLSIFSRKVDKPFKEFKFNSDKRFYGVLQEIKDSL